MVLAALIFAALWLTVIAGVVVLCFAAKQGDDAFAGQRTGGTDGDVVPLVVARRRSARLRHAVGSTR